MLRTPLWLACSLLAAPALAQTQIDQALRAPGSGGTGFPPVVQGTDSNWTDDYNRADAPTQGPDWTPQSGTFGISGNRAISGGPFNVWTQHNYASSNYATARASLDIYKTNTGLQYGALVFSAGGTDMLWIKVQGQTGTGNFSHVGFYQGTGAGAWPGGTPFMALGTEFKEGRITVYFTAGGDVCNLDIDHDFNGTIDESLTSGGLLASGLVLDGTGFGVGVIDQVYDNFRATDGSGTGINSQTLPVGLGATEGNSSSSFPINTTADHKWQWHYDNSNFSQPGPITITELYVRSNSNGAVGAFDFPSFVVTLSESTTGYEVATHDPEFALNMGANTQVVRTGAWTSAGVPASGGTLGDWIAIGLDCPFTFDPSSGNDFIVQIEKCGTNASWGTAIDGQSGSAGLNLGNRYGSTTDCAAVTSTFNNNEFVPIVRIDYTAGAATLPNGFMAAQGGSATSFPVNNTNDHKWQWHYDNTNFGRQPVEITEIYVRGGAGVAVGAFDFPSFTVTMASATTGYEVVTHDPIFANNMAINQKVVKTGAWTSAGTAADAWIPIGLDESFIFDPRSGRDFIIQTEKCGTIAAWGTTLDGVSGAAGANGGNRYGSTTDCAAVTSTFNNNEYVPIVRFDFKPASQYKPTTYCDAKQNSRGCYPVIGATGNPSATAGSGFDVSCINVRNQKSGLMFYSVSGRASIPFQGGTLCVSTPIRRTPAQVATGTTPPTQDCSGTYSLDMNAFAVGALGGSPVPALTVPGTQVNCQYFGRDQGFPAPMNTMLSNGLEYFVGI